MRRIVSRILLISGDLLAGDETLRRRVLRFTGSRRATRAILRRIEEERERGPLLTCMIAPKAPQADADPADDSSWLVGVSFAAAGPAGGLNGKV